MFVGPRQAREAKGARGSPRAHGVAHQSLLVFLAAQFALMAAHEDSQPSPHHRTGDSALPIYAKFLICPRNVFIDINNDNITMEPISLNDPILRVESGEVTPTGEARKVSTGDGREFVPAAGKYLDLKFSATPNCKLFYFEGYDNACLLFAHPHPIEYGDELTLPFPPPPLVALPLSADLGTPPQMFMEISDEALADLTRDLFPISGFE